MIFRSNDLGGIGQGCLLFSSVPTVDSLAVDNDAGLVYRYVIALHDFK